MRCPLIDIPADGATAVFGFFAPVVRHGLLALLLAVLPLVTAAGTVSYRYDDLGRLAAVAWDDGGWIEYSYDAAGR